MARECGAATPTSPTRPARTSRPPGYGYTYNQYPAGAGFGGYKQSGYGRETDQKTLHNYQEVMNVLANHDPKSLGFFA